jgi:hypothetical protein
VLDLSLFERLQNECFPTSKLFTQRRMRPLISDLVRHTLYPELEDGDNVLKYPDVRGLAKNLIFVDHEYAEDEVKNLSGSKRCDCASFNIQVISMKQRCASSCLSIFCGKATHALT